MPDLDPENKYATVDAALAAQIDVAVGNEGWRATDPSPFATKEQGQKADTAVQPDALGTAAATNSADYATAAQGQKADTALQDATAFATAGQGQKADSALQDATVFASAEQGRKADSALQDASVFATSDQGAKADSALQDATQFASAEQGTAADSAVQPGALAAHATNKPEGIAGMTELNGMWAAATKTDATNYENSPAYDEKVLIVILNPEA